MTRIADERRPVLVYGEDARGDVREAFPTRTARRSDFWGPIAAGDMLHVEVLGGARPPRLAVDRVAHGLPKDGGAALELGCYLDPTCYAFWDEIKSGVAEIYYESWWGGSSCTGSLLDDLSHTGTPWFLTANHCMSTQDEADSVIIYWNFHTSVCNGAVPPHGSLPTSSGSDVMAENETSDFTLLKLDENPPGGTWFLGWSTDALAVNDPITVIHHPDAAWKRISFGHLVGSDANFWEVVYTESSTEGGSSGSPLFNENRQVIGQLWGGYALCTRMNDTDEFGKFGESWNRGISDFLGVTTTTTTSTTTTTVPDADDDADDDVDDDASDDDSASGDDDTADETKAVLTGPSGENDLDNNDGGGFCGC
ncbi:MAG: trypsin-like peptidase domain-containing protein [Deltaproteobacteria bacterium]|nr:trypsin-like peptidase domain-containing protein [Deltaproteobacteria bacterium]